MQHLQRRSDLELVDVAELEWIGRLAELADDRRRSCVVEAVKHGCPESEQPADLLRHGLKDVLGRGVAGDEGRHSAKRRLLGCQSLLLRLGAPLLREVTGDRNHLAVSARNDPCLSPVRRTADRELVLDHLHASGLERTPDAGEDGASELVRKDVADVPADEILRGNRSAV